MMHYSVPQLVGSTSYLLSDLQEAGLSYGCRDKFDMTNGFAGTDI